MGNERVKAAGWRGCRPSFFLKILFYNGRHVHAQHIPLPKREKEENRACLQSYFAGFFPNGEQLWRFQARYVISGLASLF